MSTQAFLRLTACELLKLGRTPAFTIPTLVLPAMFFAFFGLPQAERLIGGIPGCRYLLVSYSTFAVMSVGLFAFGVSVAAERESGWSRLLRFSPVSPMLHLFSKFAVATLFAAASVLVLLGLVELTTEHCVDFVLTTVLLSGVLPGVITFSALGMAIGYLCPPPSASAMANVIFLPLAFASGLFIPLEYLPAPVQRIALSLPPYHLAVLGWARIGAIDGGRLVVSMLAVLSFIVLFVLLARLAYLQEQSREYE